MCLTSSRSIMAECILVSVHREPRTDGTEEGEKNIRGAWLVIKYSTNRSLSLSRLEKKIEHVGGWKKRERNTLGTNLRAFP